MQIILSQSDKIDIANLVAEQLMPLIQDKNWDSLPEYITTKEAAYILRCHPNTVNNYRNTGKKLRNGEIIYLSGTTNRYLKSNVLEFSHKI
jgi:hypothetical protein